MSTHIKRHHPSYSIDTDRKRKIDDENQSLNCQVQLKKPVAVGQLSLFDSFRSRLSPTSQRAQLITKQIGTFIALDMRPFSVVENPGFQKLVNLLEPKYTIPSRTHFTNKVVPQLYDETKNLVLQDIAKATSLSITTDGWTSRATEGFITITTHFMRSDWTIANYVLQTRPLHLSHTGINIGEVLKEAINEWKLKRPHGMLACVTDNASNMHIAAETAELFPHIGCFAHTINLASQRALEINTVSRLISRVKRVVAYFHRSSTAASMLKQKQDLLQLPKHKLVQDVSTRWNSSYDMLTRYLEQQPAITAVLMSPEVRKNEKDISTLSETDISNAEEMVDVLRVMKTVTTILCSEKHPTISLILPLKAIIMKKLSITEDDSNIVKI